MRATEFLTEAILEIDDDVDYLYNEYFKETIDLIAAGRWNGTLPRHSAYTDELKSDVCRNADEVNPCVILFNRDGNSYSPVKQQISITLSRSALSLLDQCGGDMGDAEKIVAKYNGPQAVTQFRNEFNPAKIKGTIHHELAHWVDDSLNNSHIRKQVERGMAARAPSLARKPGESENAYEFERQGQLHAIYQLKKHYADQWDKMTLSQMFQLSGPLNAIYTKMPDAQKAEWIRKLRQRMHREGLLGNNMTQL